MSSQPFTPWPAQPPTNILVRMPNWIGDLVMATPVLKDLKDHFKGAKLTAMCLAGQGALIDHHPYVDEVFQFHRTSGWIHRPEHHDIFEPLQRGNYDLGLLLTNSFSSAWWLWRGRVKNRIGYSMHGRWLLLNHPVCLPIDYEKVHQVTLYKRLLVPLGIPVSDSKPELFVSDESFNAARALLRKYGVDRDSTLLGINPGAAYGTAKCWPPERFREVILQLLKQPENRIVCFGDHGSASVVNEICRDLPKRVINLAGKTSLSELVALIKCCDVLLSNDSGPMHIATAVGTPPLALFGSTSDTKTSPYGMGKVIHKHVECSPCYRRVCPIDFRCMKRIEVEEVYRELQTLVQERRLIRRET